MSNGNSVYSDSWSKIFVDCPTCFYKSKTIIMEEGSNINKVFFIQKGKIRFSVITPDGNEKTMYYLNKGGIFGDVCSVADRPSNMTATTVTSCSISYMDPASFLKIVQRNYEMTKEWVSSISEIIEFLMEHVTDLTFLDKESILCKYIYRLSLNYGVETEFGIKINSKITHLYLADIIGCSRVTVSKIMSNLLKNRIIRKQKGFFYITDIEELKEHIK